MNTEVAFVIPCHLYEENVALEFSNYMSTPSSEEPFIPAGIPMQGKDGVWKLHSGDAITFFMRDGQGVLRCRSSLANGEEIMKAMVVLLTVKYKQLFGVGC